MPNLISKSSVTNAVIVRGTLVFAKGASVVNNFKIFGTISNIGLDANGYFATDLSGTHAQYARIADEVTDVSLTSDGKIITPNRLLKYLRYGSNLALVQEPAADHLVHYTLDGNDSALTRTGGDDYRLGKESTDVIATWFDGSTQYSDSSETDVFGTIGDGAFSFSLWVNTLSSSRQVMFCNGGYFSGTDNFGFEAANANVIRIAIAGATDSFSTTAIFDGNWHHVVLTSTGTGGTAELFIDGGSIGTTSISTYNFADTGVFRIGARSASDRKWTGGLDGIRIYDRVLTQAEITGLKNYVGDFNPSEVTTSLWLDAQDQDTITETASAVSQWDDKSPSGYDLTQGTGSLQPITGTLVNGLNSIEFSTTSKILQRATVNLTQFTVFALWKGNGSETQGRILNYENASPRVINLEHRTAQNDLRLQSNDDTNTGSFDVDVSRKSVLNMLAIKYDTTNSTMTYYFNGTELGSTTYDGDTRFTRIGTAFNVLQGNLLELVIMDSILDSDIDKMNGYLAWKGGIQSDLSVSQPYKTEPPMRD